MIDIYNNVKKKNLAVPFIGDDQGLWLTLAFVFASCVATLHKDLFCAITQNTSCACSLCWQRFIYKVIPSCAKMIAAEMVLRWIVGSVEGAPARKNLKHALGAAAFEPLETYIHGF